MGSLDRNSVDRAIEQFLRRIILTKTQHERAESAIINIKNLLNASDLSPAYTSIYTQGSFSTRTTLKPDTKRVATAEYDVDIVAESANWDENDPHGALNTVHKILLDGGIPAPRLETKMSCVRVKYADGIANEKFHVDVIPIYNDFSQRKAPKCTDDEAEWIDSDPSKLTKWFNKKSEDSPTFRAQYLLMKRFAQMNGIKVPSIAIQKIVADSYVFKQQDSRYMRELLDMCRTAAQNLNDQNYSLTNPVNNSEDLRPRIKSGELDRYKILLANAVKAIERFSSDGTYDDAVSLFGDKFPTKESHEEELSLRTKGLYFDCDFADRVDLSAKARNGDVQGTSYRLEVSADHENLADRSPVDNITFKVKDFVQHHKVIWQIVNDPKQVNFQIRGNFEDSSDIKINEALRNEAISYAGNHFVMAFIIQGNRCKAISHKFNVNVVRAST